ncbi:hypothetical protein GCM10023213_40030 [Prosthecobacter algae]|uniref:histidine kinase n=1 Tax=Prosthecobacter algae TaxID=1144682 RepID=A0ABP9PHJ3_9BACT
MQKIFSLFSGLGAAIGWLALVSLLYGSDPQRPNLIFGIVSLPASLALLILSMGLALLRPHEGVVRILMSRSPAGKLVRQLLPLALLVTFVFGLVRLWAQARWSLTTEFGAAFYCTMTMAILILVILRHAQTVQHSDRLRAMAKRRATRSLEERERRFRGIFNNTSQFIGMLTPDGVLTEANRSSLEATGLTAQDVIGKHFWEVSWWRQDEREQARIRESIAKAAAGEAVYYQTVYRSSTGEWRPVDFSLSPVFDEAGKVIFLVPEGRDATDHHRATGKLENISQRLVLATQASGIGIWDWDVVTNKLVWDETMFRIYQVSCPEGGPSYQIWENCMHQDDREGAVAALQLALGGGADFSTVFRIVWPDGSIHYIQTKAIVQKDGEGRPVRMLGTNADITKQVMAEARLQESEERFRHAFEYSAIGFALLDQDGGWMAVNRALCEIVGYTEGELAGQRFHDITHPEDLEKDLENVTRLIRGEITHYQMEKRYIRKGGHIVWVLLTASLVKEDDGSPAYFISQVEDITQRHEADLVLKHQQGQLRKFIEHTPAAVAMFDLKMNYVAASQRWLEDYHLQAQPLLGRSHYEVFPEIGPEWKAIHQRCLEGAVESRDEDMFIRQDGQTEWLRWEVRPWLEAGGEIGGIVMFTEVITERKNAAEKIRTSLEEKEVLLREIHHRVKNNMQIISSLLQLQTSSLHDPADVAIFKDCQTRIHAMAMVHDRLYRSGNLSTINFGAHLCEVANLMACGQASSMTHIRLETQCDDVELDLDKAIPLGLIATELITNAFKHAFKGREMGCIRISLRRTGGKQMQLQVEDDGNGLPPGSDPVSSRTLGLRLVRSLSHQLRARILFPPTSGGCCVEITFDV